MIVRARPSSALGGWHCPCRGGGRAEFKVSSTTLCHIPLRSDRFFEET